MKKIMMIGPVGSGKTSLLQRLNEQQIVYKKTQSIEYEENIIDTPGEYIENRQYLYALTVSAADADVIVFTQDSSIDNTWYSPGQASMFAVPVIGAVTKVDLASNSQINAAEEVLKIAGVRSVFKISSISGDGIAELKNYLMT